MIPCPPLTTAAAPSITLRRQVFAQLFDPAIKNNLRPQFERFITTLTVANMLALIFENVSEVYQPGPRLLSHL